MDDLLSLKLEEVPVRKVQSDQRFPKGQHSPTSPGQSIQPPKNLEQDYDGSGVQADANHRLFSSTPYRKQPETNDTKTSPEAGDEGKQFATERLLSEKRHMPREDHITEWMNAAFIVNGAVREAIRSFQKDEAVFRPTRKVKASSGSFSAVDMEILQDIYPGVGEQEIDNAAVGDEESSNSSSQTETEVFTTPPKSDIDDIVIDFNKIKPESYGSPVDITNPIYSPILSMSRRGHAEGDSSDGSASPTTENSSLVNPQNMATDIDFVEVLQNIKESPGTGNKRSPGNDGTKQSPGDDDIKRSPSDDDIKRSPGDDDIKRLPINDDITRSLGYDDIERSPGDDDYLLSARTDASYRTAVQSFGSDYGVDYLAAFSDADGLEYSPYAARSDTVTPTRNDSCHVIENLLSQVKLSDTPGSVDGDKSAVQGLDLDAWLEGTMTPDAERTTYSNSCSNSTSSKSSRKSSVSSQEATQSGYSSVKSESASSEHNSSKGSDDEMSYSSYEKQTSDVSADEVPEDIMSAEEVPEDMYVESYDSNTSDDLETTIAKFTITTDKQVNIQSAQLVPGEAAGDLPEVHKSCTQQLAKSRSAPGDIIDVAASPKTEKIVTTGKDANPKPVLRYATQDSFASSTGSLEETKPIGSMSQKMHRAKWDLTQLSTESEDGPERCRDMREVFKRQTAVSLQSSADLEEVHEDVEAGGDIDPKVLSSEESGMQFSAGHLGPEEEEALRMLTSNFDDSQLSSPTDLLSPPDGVRAESQPLMERYKLSVEGMHPAEVQRLQKKYPSAFVIPPAFLRSSAGDDSSPDNLMVTDIDACATEDDSMENIVDVALEVDEPDSSSDMAPQTFYIDDHEEDQQPYASHDANYGTHTAFHLFDYNAHTSTDGYDSGFFNPAFIQDDNVAAEVEVISENEITLEEKLKEGAVYAFGNLAYDDDEAPDAESSTTKPGTENGPCTEGAERYYPQVLPKADPNPALDEPEDTVEEYVDGVIKSAVKELQEHPNSAGRRGRRVGTPTQGSKKGSRANTPMGGRGGRGNSARSGGRGDEEAGHTAGDTEKSKCCCTII